MTLPTLLAASDSLPDLLAVVAIAAGAVGGAVVWRIQSRQRVRRQITEALAASDLATRIAAIEVIAGHGIGPFATILLARARYDNIPTVLDAIADVVARNQWEPISTPDMASLRLWAQHRLTVMGVSRSDLSPAAAIDIEPVSEPTPTLAHQDRPRLAPPDHLADGQAEVSQTKAGPAEVSPAEPVGPVETPEAGTAAEPVPVTRLGFPGGPPVVMVTGAASPTGSATVRALRSLGYRVVAGDIPGRHDLLPPADAVAALPDPDAHDYVDRLCESALRYGATVLLPTDPDEFEVLALYRRTLVDHGLATWLPDLAATTICGDGMALRRSLVTAGIRIASNFGPGPVGTEEHPDEGKPFLAEALVGRDGNFVGAVTLWPLLERDGLTIGARTFYDQRVEAILDRTLVAVGLRGPASLHGMVSPDGVASIGSVRPGFSGALALATATGADLVGQYLHGVLGQPLDGARLRCQPGLTVVRYSDDLVSVGTPTPHMAGEEPVDRRAVPRVASEEEDLAYQAARDARDAGEGRTGDTA